jgi:hypothetical protein
MSERKWVRSSLRYLQERLEVQVSHTTIGRLLRALDYSLEGECQAADRSLPSRSGPLIYLPRELKTDLFAGGIARHQRR